MDKFVFAGNVGGEPTLRYTKSGLEVVDFSVAVSRSVKNQQTGQWEKATMWVKCTLFGKRAVNFSNYVGKGDGVAVEGKIKFDAATGAPRVYIGKDGVARSSLEVIVDDYDITNHRSGKNPNQQPTQPPAQQWQQQPTQPPAQQQWQQQQPRQPQQQPAQQPQSGGYDEIPF